MQIFEGYHFFTAKELKPTGWLRAQLRRQADGLCGNLDKVWPDIKESQWIGGDREGWERVPYWLDGFIPMAWLLEDTELQARATAYVDAILNRQAADGWICPCREEERATYDIWAAFLICKVLVVYYECTGDPRIEDAIDRALRCILLHIERQTLFGWASARWYECLIPLLWLYQRRPEHWMIDLAITLKTQGFDYKALFADWPYQKPQEQGRWNFMTHVVNLSMCLKFEVLFAKLTGKSPEGFAEQALAILLRDHGMPIDHFSGDECLSGRSPIRGTELCGVVEAMYSYEWLLALTGNDHWADRLETLAFNALPAAISPDMWSHQYDQMSNQVECTPLKQPHFQSNDGDAHLFGLEPHFGCCTANFGQGWPKFTLSTFLSSKDGIAIGAIAPCRLDTRMEDAAVSCELLTAYPFQDGYQLRIVTDRPVRFSLSLRIPAAAQTILIDGVPFQGTRQTLNRVWDGETTLTVAFGFSPALVPFGEGFAFARRGPLVYALPIEAEWKQLEYIKNGVERKAPYCDYELHPRSAWEFAFAQDTLTFHRSGMTDVPFAPESAPVRLTVRLKPIDWPMENGLCAETPHSTDATGADEDHDLIPYGCTNLRMTVMPSP